MDSAGELVMFFPNSPHLPTLGDRVCYRADFHPRPYTVTFSTHDRYGNLWLSLEGVDEPARVEELAWYPQKGDRVELRFSTYVNWLQARFTECMEQGQRDRLEAVKAAMKKSQHYRTGDLVQVDGPWVKIRFGAAGDEVVPISCIAVTERKQVEAQQISIFDAMREAA
ncbi:hypothetical protein H6F75_00315 [Nodosilinea sp. FACHB-131]|uniref:hypothetical protein n=1 Tax=Cyanophyceae TaxID=3028117 RepID=UPI001686F349|nr:hypothetical protein [Nodosilinea sp. FACHB-131]MBD1871913.1 hypothetical protein [Nodosilinea sp. FACHB-131]